MNVAVWALIGYAAGSFPSAWVVALAAGKRAVLDKVQRNVGEADAHVLLQEAGSKAAYVAAVLDVLKGFLPVLAALRLAGPYEIAACAIAAVAGHCWPPILGRYAGRGLAAGAGAFLGFLPVEMAIAGAARIIGSFVRAGGLTSTIGYLSIPVVAVLRGQPAPYIVAAIAINAIAINVLIFVRRLEGLGEDVDGGLPLGRAVLRRTLLDASGAR
jgi:glycerol-3-phosphate acyltransferase PlsY